MAYTSYKYFLQIIKSSRRFYFLIPTFFVTILFSNHITFVINQHSIFVDYLIFLLHPKSYVIALSYMLQFLLNLDFYRLAFRFQISFLVIILHNIYLISFFSKYHVDQISHILPLVLAHLLIK